MLLGRAVRQSLSGLSLKNAFFHPLPAVKYYQLNLPDPQAPPGPGCCPLCCEAHEVSTRDEGIIRTLFFTRPRFSTLSSSFQPCGLEKFRTCRRTFLSAYGTMLPLASGSGFSTPSSDSSLVVLEPSALSASSCSSSILPCDVPSASCYLQHSQGECPEPDGIPPEISPTNSRCLL